MSAVNATSATSASSRELILHELRGAERFILVTHENPDGDALGSLVAMHGVLSALGKDSVMFMGAGEFPLPYEYRFFVLDGLVSEAPADLDDRTVVFLDCGNIDRNPAEVVKRPGAHILNVDHHHDNTRFGTINWVEPAASSTAQLVWELAHLLGVPITPELAEPLYVGLLTDTGRFSYENTTPRAHAMAADLIEAGVDLTGVRRRLYEDVLPAKLHLLRYALDSFVIHGSGTLISARVTAHDFDAAGATEAHAEGIIDVLRAVRGVRIAALARELEMQPGTFKVSLRAADPSIDVSAIARAGGGGGHPQAAGFTTELPDADLAAFVLDQLALQGAGGVPAA